MNCFGQGGSRTTENTNITRVQLAIMPLTGQRAQISLQVGLENQTARLHALSVAKYKGQERTIVAKIAFGKFC
jgi:hypothetical protein